MRKITGPIRLHSQGMVTAFDDNEQVPELQTSLISLWAENAVKNGFDPDGAIIRTASGSVRVIKCVDTDDDSVFWNFELA